MIEFIDNVFPYLFIIGIIAFVIFFIMVASFKLQFYSEYNLLNYFEDNIYFRTSAILTIIAFIAIFSLNSYVSKLSRNEIKEKIENLNQEEYSLEINGKIEKNDILLIELKNIKKESTGRNTGIVKINLKIKSKNKILNLMLLRDFQDKTKYWVHYENYEITSDNCIGEIKTKVLNDYK